MNYEFLADAMLAFGFFTILAVALFPTVRKAVAKSATSAEGVTARTVIYLIVAVLVLGVLGLVGSSFLEQLPSTVGLAIATVLFIIVMFSPQLVRYFINRNKPKKQ